MSFARKREYNVAAAEGFGFVCAKAQRQQQHDVGHEGVITGRDAFSLRSSISLIPKESPSRNEDQHSNRLKQTLPQLLVMCLFINSFRKLFIRFKFPNTVYIIHKALIFLVKKHESQHVDSC
ncbi:hypothetical protein B1B04_01840 [Lysinibacillus sp. KCTC 33748]|nr:hypothetical protein B1B04_01840 [Lysinibacillus sp. KCTC 33748]